MDRALNGSQLDVLRWLVDRPSDPEPPGNWKTSAVALENRGLVTISRKGGQYRATPTEAGRYYRQHGTYPPAPELVSPAQSAPAPRRQTAPAQNEAGPRAEKHLPTAPPRNAPPKPAGAVGPSLEDVLDPRPHPAVRSLWKHPAALPADPAARDRAVLAAHELVVAAKQAGYQVEGHVQPRKRPTVHGLYLGEPLVTLDAGDSPVLVKVGELMQRVPHELAKEEQSKKRRNQYFYAPTYDHVGTGVSCFRVYTDRATGGGARYAETKTKPLSSFVPAIISAVERASDAKRERAEAQQRRQEQQRLEELARRELAARRSHYEKWEASLDAQVEAWKRAEEVRAYLDVLERQHDKSEALAFITWAREHLALLDPAQTLALPSGEVPELNHAERRRLGRPQEQRWPRW